MASFTVLKQATQTESQAVPAPDSLGSGELALLLTAALAGASMTKAARKQYRALARKMFWQAMGSKLKNLFSKEHRGEPIAGLDPLIFWLLVAAVALLGILLFGFWGFLVIGALGVIIYLLLRQQK